MTSTRRASREEEAAEEQQDDEEEGAASAGHGLITAHAGDEAKQAKAEGMQQEHQQHKREEPA